MTTGAPRSPEVRIALLGFPSRLMTWMSVFLRALFEEGTDGNFDGVVLDSDDGMAQFLSDAQASNLMIVSHFPRHDLIRLLDSERILTLVALDDCVSAASQAMFHGVPLYQEAIRPITESLSRLARSHQLPLRSVITTAHGGVPFHDFATRLSILMFGKVLPDLHMRLARYNLNCDLTIAEAIESTLGPPPAMPAQLGEREGGLIRQVCEPLIGILMGQDEAEILWDVAFFYEGECFSMPAPLSLDLVGPARCLYYGPFLHLPEGSYSAILTIGLSNEIRDTLLRVEVYTTQMEAEFIAHAKSGGLYYMLIDFDVVDAGRAIQLRIFIDRGEIEGRIGFANTKLKPTRMGWLDPLIAKKP
ncbi:MAG: hypothetical protein IOC55_04180 [Methylobacterium sp.]|jgi:hypothetical protein|nr:hypothetical protein [Methylobacterium sp.]